jgi:hypothetical protein
MGLFDGLLGNLEDAASKLGIPAETLSALAETVQSKLGQGGDHIAALTEAAKEHGLSLDSLKGLIANGGEGAQDMLGKVSGLFDKDGDGSPLNDIGEFAKGFFGKK